MARMTPAAVVLVVDDVPRSGRVSSRWDFLTKPFAGQGPPGRDPAGRGEGHARPRDGGASGWTSARPHELDRRL